jgi:N-acetylglucosaminyldiphosphoundecaprenol N-acetyl-beta-D-mannosaminyltransferase
MKKRNTVNILGVNFDNVTMQEAIEIGLGLFKDEAKHAIYTPNPEIVMAAIENASLKDSLNKGSLVIPDGIGVVIGSRIIKKQLKERVAGYDFVQLLFDQLKNSDKTVYFFGSKEGTAELAAKNMMQKYSGLKIVGVHHGYVKDTTQVIEDINRLKPDLVLVGLGAPRQEAWISEHMQSLNTKVLIGVGGSMDVMSGLVKRAPKLFIRLHLEWFHRLITQPSRFFRMLKLPQFLIKMMIEGKKYT